MKRFAMFIYLVFLIFIFSACSRDSNSFTAGDIKKDFCGIHLNYQYCECAFENSFCEEIAMGSKEAKDYVNSEYDKWVLKESMAFAEQCTKENGIMKDGECDYCSEGKIVVNGACERNRNDDGSMPEKSKENAGPSCESDSECSAVCQNNTLIESKCNMEKNRCEKLSEKNCTLNLESFGDLVFPMICVNNACQRDETAVTIKREELQAELGKLQPSMIQEGAGRLAISTALGASRKYCQAEELAVGKDEINQYETQITETTTILKEVDKTEQFGEKLSALRALKEKEKLSEEDNTVFKNLSCYLAEFMQVALDNEPVGNNEARARVKEIEAILEVLPKNN